MRYSLETSGYRQNINKPWPRVRLHETWERVVCFLVFAIPLHAARRAMAAKAAVVGFFLHDHIPSPTALGHLGLPYLLPPIPPDKGKEKEITKERKALCPARPPAPPHSFFDAAPDCISTSISPSSSATRPSGVSSSGARPRDGGPLGGPPACRGGLPPPPPTPQGPRMNVGACAL